MMWGWKDSTILSIDTIVRYRYFTDARLLKQIVIPALGLSCDTTDGVIHTSAIINGELRKMSAAEMHAC